jgi:hypothetical protein
MRQSQTFSVVLTIALTALLAGCSSPTPAATGASSTPSATAIPSATPEPPVVAALVVGGAALTAVDDAGAEVWRTPYTSDPAAVVTTLTEVFGSAPEVVVHPGDQNCTPEDTRASWGGFAVSYDTDFLPEGQLFQVLAESPAVDEIAVRTTHDAAVGSTLAEVSSGLPAVQIGQEFELESGVVQWVHYEVAAGEYADPTSPESMPEYWGATARLTDGAVDLLMAPTTFVDYC